MDYQTINYILIAVFSLLVLYVFFIPLYNKVRGFFNHVEELKAKVCVYETQTNWVKDLDKTRCGDHHRRTSDKVLDNTPL